MSPLSEKETARTLLGLLEAGIIEEVGPTAPSPSPIHPDVPTIPSGTQAVPPLQEADNAPPEDSLDPKASAKQEIEQLFQSYPGMDHWEVLGLERGATKKEVTGAFHEKASLYHPDNYHHIRDREFQEQLSQVFYRIKEAYETLSREDHARGYGQLAEKERQYEEQNRAWSAPPPNEETSETKEARQPQPSRSIDEGKALFAKAKHAFIQHDFWMTIQFCQQAIEIISDNPEFYHLLAMAQKENPKWRKDAEKNLQIAIKLDPWKPDYLAALGKLYQDSGLNTRAAKMFDQVRTLDPTFAIPESD